MTSSTGGFKEVGTHSQLRFQFGVVRLLFWFVFSRLFCVCCQCPMVFGVFLCVSFHDVVLLISVLFRVSSYDQSEIVD